jgi:hypothetical protein
VDEDVADDMTIDGVTVDDVTATWQMTWQPHGPNVAATWQMMWQVMTWQLARSIQNGPKID